MPLYEFECLDCSARFEQLVRSAEAVREVVCRTCGSSNIRKIISAGSHRLGSSPSPPAAGASCPSGSRFR